MKFVTLFATLATVAKVSFAAYCGSQCDPNKVPDTPLSGPLKLVAVVDNKDSSIKYNVAGTVVIENDCVFTVKGFTLTPKSDNAKWYGASDPNSSEGILLSKQNVGVTSSPTDLTYNIKDTDTFCHASLLTNVGNGGVLRLMDQNYQLLAFANISAGAKTTAAAAKTTTKEAAKSTSTKKSKTSTTTKKEASKTSVIAESTTPAASDATKPGNSTDTDATAAQANQANQANETNKIASNTASAAPAATGTGNANVANSQSSGALSNFKIPSLALYVTLFVVAFIRF